MILFSETYSREGNDSWLIDIVEIHRDEMGLNLIHKYKWSGWAGTDKGSSIIELDEYDVDKAQERIDQFLNEHSLYYEYPSGTVEGIREINLKDILEKKKDPWD